MGIEKAHTKCLDTTEYGSFHFEGIISFQGLSQTLLGD